MEKETGMWMELHKPAQGRSGYGVPSRCCQACSVAEVLPGEVSAAVGLEADVQGLTFPLQQC